MRIAVDKTRCKRCGICIRMMEGYCISEQDGFPVFDAALCNTCQKCVAVCPSRAITVNGIYPDPLKEIDPLDPGLLYALLEKRRSIKHFQNRPIPREMLERIVSVAKYAPNQNKNISVHVFDDSFLIQEIDRAAVNFVKTIYRLLFGFKPFELLVRLFYKDAGTLKRKMNHNDFQRVVYENTGAIIVVSGNKSVPVTESSAHYMLAAMALMAESMGIGNCLMDSVYLTLRTNGKLRRTLNIRENVLGAMILGYSAERVCNIPRGYEVDIHWNGKL